MTRIKLCGMMRREDIEAVNSLLPDYCGFILSDGFRRSIGRDEFSELSELLDKRVKCVGVFVNEPIETIASEYAARLDLIQLHGSEDNEYIRTLSDMTGKPVIKAFRITSEADIHAADRSAADYVLLDSGTGTGRTFDHSLIKDIDRPFFLAGGLTPDNIGEALSRFSPFAVDASSSLETDGRKDRIKMTEFVNAVRKG